MPSLTEFRSSGSKARSAMNREMVKPIPVSRLPFVNRLNGTRLNECRSGVAQLGN